MRNDVAEGLAELRRLGIIDNSYTDCAPLSGGTSETAYGVGCGVAPELVLKLDRPPNTWATARFLETYGGRPVVPALCHVDRDYRFLVYRYAPGELTRNSATPIDKRETLLTLSRELLCHYLPANVPTACWLDELYHPRDRWQLGLTWQGYLEMVLSHRHEPARPHLPRGAEALVRALAAAPQRRGEGSLALQHGDCGAHNFVFHEGHLVAVIDPRPVAGEPIWDLVSAFVSWPGDLTLDTLLPAVEALERAGRWLPEPHDRQRAIIEEVVIAIYSWTAICAQHVPEDLPVYAAAWEHWVDLLRRAS